MTDKQALRAWARAARQGISPEERVDAATAVAARVLDLPGIERPGAVLGYAATDEEIDPGPLLEVLRARGWRVALPRVDAPANLALHWVRERDTLVPGPFRILEPAEDAPLAAPADIDLALVPGLAFDAECRRVGYGGCFYDSLLPLLRPDAVTAGLAFDVQLVPEVPVEAHDVPVRWVVTPRMTFAAG